MAGRPDEHVQGQEHLAVCRIQVRPSKLGRQSQDIAAEQLVMAGLYCPTSDTDVEFLMTKYVLSRACEVARGNRVGKATNMTSIEFEIMSRKSPQEPASRV